RTPQSLRRTGAKPAAARRRAKVLQVLSGRVRRTSHRDYSNGLFRGVKYYTDAGELKGVRAFSDAIDAECGGRDDYGYVPQCTHSVSEEVVDAFESLLRSSL
ncbi:MAG: hypothetical protein ACOYM9_17780, partial [Bradymonadia bacterium]